MSRVMFIIFPFLLFNSNLYARKVISYKLPPKIDSILSEYIASMDKSFLKTHKIYGVLREHNDTFTLILPFFTKINKVNNDEYIIAKISNRNIVINSRYNIPTLLSNFDNKLIRPDYILKENGQTIHDSSIILHHSFFIEFTLFNEVLQLSYNGYGDK